MWPAHLQMAQLGYFPGVRAWYVFAANIGSQMLSIIIFVQKVAESCVWEVQGGCEQAHPDSG